MKNHTVMHGVYIKIVRYFVAVMMVLTVEMSMAKIDIMQVWNGELKLWEMPPNEFRGIQKALPMSEAILVSPWYDEEHLDFNSKGLHQALNAGHSMLGTFGMGEWRARHCFSYWTDGKKVETADTAPAPGSSEQWVRFWQKYGEQIDKIEDRRLVKVQTIYEFDHREFRGLRYKPDENKKEKKKTVSKFEDLFNKATGKKGKQIKETRPADATGRKYSGTLWVNDNCAILLEKVSTPAELVYIMITIAKDEKSLNYMEPTNVDKEVTGKELATRVEEKDGKVMLKDVPPAYLSEGCGNRVGDVVDVVFRYYRMGHLGAGVVNKYWLPDGAYQSRHPYVDYTMNLSSWLEMGHKTKCGFDELWNQSPGKLGKSQKAKWYKLVLENLRAGRPVLCYVKETDSKDLNIFSLQRSDDETQIGFHLIIGCHESDDKVFLKTLMQEDGSEYVEVEGSAFANKCAAMYSLIPGGGKRSHKRRWWDSCKRDPEL